MIRGVEYLQPHPALFPYLLGRERLKVKLIMASDLINHAFEVSIKAPKDWVQ